MKDSIFSLCPILLGLSTPLTQNKSQMTDDTNYYEGPSFPPKANRLKFFHQTKHIQLFSLPLAEVDS
jgi:hypothetical protein